MIEVGDFISDNDPRRIKKRTLEIISIFDDINENYFDTEHIICTYVLAKNKNGQRE